MRPMHNESDNYAVALMLDSGEFEVVEWFTAADDAEANKYAEDNYGALSWYVLDRDGSNING